MPDDVDARIEAIRGGRIDQPIEVAAIGVVFAEVLRPVTLEPLPWPQVDALRAIDSAARAEGADAADEGRGS